MAPMPEDGQPFGGCASGASSCHPHKNRLSPSAIQLTCLTRRRAGAGPTLTRCPLEMIFLWGSGLKAASRAVFSTTQGKVSLRYVAASQ